MKLDNWQLVDNNNNHISFVKIEDSKIATNLTFYYKDGHVHIRLNDSNIELREILQLSRYAKKIERMRNNDLDKN